VPDDGKDPDDPPSTGVPDPVEHLAGQAAQHPLVAAGLRQGEQRGPESGLGPAGRPDHDVLQRSQPVVQADALQGPGHAERGEIVRPDLVPSAAEVHLAVVRPDEAAQDVQ